MPFRNPQNITGFQGAAPGATGSVVNPPGYRYHDYTLFFTNAAGVLTNPAVIATNIKLKVGGVTIRDMSPDQCIRLARMYGITPGLGECPLFFSEPWLADPRTREMFSWDMAGQGKFTTEVTFATIANNPGGVGIQNIVANVDTVRNQYTPRGATAPKPFLKIIKAKNETFLFAGAARLGNVTLDKSLPIRRLLIDASANGFSDLEVIADGASVINQQLLAQILDDLNHYAAVGQTIDGTQFSMPILFDKDGLGRSKLSAAALEVKLTATGALVATILNMQEASAFA